MSECMGTLWCILTLESHIAARAMEMERASPSVSPQLLGAFSVPHPVRKNMELCEHRLPPQPVPAS